MQRRLRSTGCRVARAIALAGVAVTGVAMPGRSDIAMSANRCVRTTLPFESPRGTIRSSSGSNRCGKTWSRAQDLSCSQASVMSSPHASTRRSRKAGVCILREAASARALPSVCERGRSDPAPGRLEAKAAIERDSSRRGENGSPTRSAFAKPALVTIATGMFSNPYSRSLLDAAIDGLPACCDTSGIQMIATRRPPALLIVAVILLASCARGLPEHACVISSDCIPSPAPTQPTVCLTSHSHYPAGICTQDCTTQ